MERKQIIDKTTSLIKKYGIKSMTLDDISIRLGISKKALYSHFNTKEELLLECLNFINDTVEDLLNNAKSNSPNPVVTLIRTYNFTTAYLLEFQSTFYFDLRKIPNLKSATLHHIDAYKLNRIRPLIVEAKNSNFLIPDADVDDAVECYMRFIPIFFVNFKDDQAAIENHLTLFLNNYFIVKYNKQE